MMTKNQALMKGVQIHVPRDNVENYRRNFRKKTDFTKWADALYGQTYFNPPHTGV